MKIIIMLFLLIGNISMASYLDTWDSLLKKYAVEGEKEGISVVLVDYKGIKKDNEFKKLLIEVKEVDLKKLSKNQEKAFWINVYNIGAVKMVTENYPLKSIKDVGNILSPVWKKPIIKVGDKTYYLDQIEHDILGKDNDELIHFGIVCASLSCPDLKMTSYRGENLRDQLMVQREKFIRNKTKGMNKINNTVYISKIFKWYEKDFNNINEYLKIPLDENLKYMRYNWNLNNLD